MFRRNRSPPSSWSKKKTSKKQAGDGLRAELAPCFCFFLLGLFFYREYGDNIFLRNVVLPPIYMALKYRRPHSSY
jgi:hypothetical protein